MRDKLVSDETDYDQKEGHYEFVRVESDAVKAFDLHTYRAICASVEIDRRVEVHSHSSLD